MNRLDRRCGRCGNRVRVTLDRSSSGQGRLRTVEIWERGLSTGIDELQEEVVRRDGGKDGLAERFDVDASKQSAETTQADLPVIWGAGWQPEVPLSFTRSLDHRMVREQLLTFVAERHDGHLDVVAACWDAAGAPTTFDGVEFHKFSSNLLEGIRGRLAERLLEPQLAALEDAVSWSACCAVPSGCSLVLEEDWALCLDYARATDGMAAMDDADKAGRRASEGPIRKRLANAGWR